MSLVAHVTTRPVRTLPFASCSVAVSCSVARTFTLGLFGPTVTVATGIAVTVTADVPLCPSLVAVIVTGPAPTPETRPVALTVARVGSLLVHVTTRPVRGLPFASFGVAASCTVAPTITPAGLGGTVTVATGTGRTVSAELPRGPSD